MGTKRVRRRGGITALTGLTFGSLTLLGITAGATQSGALVALRSSSPSGAQIAGQYLAALGQARVKVVEVQGQLRTLTVTVSPAQVKAIVSPLGASLRSLVELAGLTASASSEPKAGAAIAEQYLTALGPLEPEIVKVQAELRVLPITVSAAQVKAIVSPLRNDLGPVAKLLGPPTGTASKPPSNVTTTTTGTTTPNHLVKPVTGVQGRFCQAMATNHASDPTDNTAGITPESSFWGSTLVILPGTPQSVEDDVDASLSDDAATFVVLQAWQANGNQYVSLTPSCLHDYDPLFNFVSPSTPSTSTTEVSTELVDIHSINAVRSASGTCWYNLNVMDAGDPIINQDGLQAYGTYWATKTHGPCTAATAPGYGVWGRADPFPPQLEVQQRLAYFKIVG